MFHSANWSQRVKEAAAAEAAAVAMMMEMLQLAPVLHPSIQVVLRQSLSVGSPCVGQVAHNL
jgi:hypothetical protein